MVTQILAALRPRSQGSSPWVIFISLLVLISGISLFHVQAQQPVFRIGILDSPLGAISRGARLAVQEINSQGGVTGADGTAFRLELVVQPTENIDAAINNLAQASVIAVLGPAEDSLVLNNLTALQSLGVPVLTPSTDDTVLAKDNSGLLFRLRAQEAMRGLALADYLVNDLGVTDLVTVQLDVQSTASIIGFTNALRRLGVTPSRTYLLDETNSLEQIVENVATRNPPVVVTYGPPATASILYSELRNAGWDGRFAYPQAELSEFRADLPFERLTGVIGSTTWSYTTPNRASEAFVLSFISTFGEIPGPIEAAAYDGIQLIAEAIGEPGNLVDNLNALSEIRGVQGILRAETLSAGELSNNVAIIELGAFGAPDLVARYAGPIRITDDEEEDDLIGIATEIARVTPTAAATATPEGVWLRITRAVQNVRTGPGLNYDIIGQLQEGDTAQVIGANLDFSWVVISFRGSQGWLSRGILDVFGDRNTVPIIAAPPTPTPPPPSPTPSPQPVADIIIVGATPNRLPIGVPFNVIVTVRNQGLLSAGGFAIAATLEPGSVYSAVNLPGLAAGTQTNVTLSGVLTGPTGPRSVAIVADLNNQVDEGPQGEANNDDFVFNYIADRPTLTPGGLATITLAPGSTINLDSSNNDLLWTGSELIAQNGAQIYLLTGFSSLDEVHYDAISTTTNASPIGVTFLQNNALIGLVTDNANMKRGVLRVDQAITGGTLTITFRVYN